MGWVLWSDGNAFSLSQKGFAFGDVGQEIEDENEDDEEIEENDFGNILGHLKVK